MQLCIGRKAEQLYVSIARDVEVKREEGWGDIYLSHECLPEIDRDEVGLSVRLCGRCFRYPLIISALTGGH